MSFIYSTYDFHIIGVDLSFKGMCFRFRMYQPLFNQICCDVVVRNPKFLHKPDALGVTRFHQLHKCVVDMKMLGHGSNADDMDDVYAMGESVILDCVKEFTSALVVSYNISSRQFLYSTLNYFELNYMVNKIDTPN
jgi:hypothetical protein